MIVGGKLRGLSRAVDHSLTYIAIFSLAGLFLGVALALFTIGTGITGVFAILIIGTIYSVIVILPTAVFANFIALRVFRPRSWRREKWRAWVAGLLAVPFCWGGPILWLYLEPELPAMLRWLGGDWGRIFYGSAVVILFS